MNGIGAGVVIVYMHPRRDGVPLSDPIHHGDLERGETFGIVIVRVYFFPVEQTIYIRRNKDRNQSLLFFP